MTTGPVIGMNYHASFNAPAESPRQKSKSNHALRTNVSSVSKAQRLDVMNQKDFISQVNQPMTEEEGKRWEEDQVTLKKMIKKQRDAAPTSPPVGHVRNNDYLPYKHHRASKGEYVPYDGGQLQIVTTPVSPISTSSVESGAMTPMSVSSISPSSTPPK